MIVQKEIGTTRKRSGESGFGLPELLIAVAIITAITAVTVINFKSARASLRVQNSVRQLASYMEKARVDAVRRHSASTVTFTSPTSYTVNMDFLNTGAPIDRSFNFESGVQIANNTELPKVTFNWRGRTVTPGATCVTTFSVKSDSSSDGLNVDVSGSGDVTVENQQPTLPNVPYNNTTPASVRAVTVVSGTDTVDSTPCLDVSGEGVAGDSGAPQCLIHVSATSVSVKKNGGGSTSVLVSMSVSSNVVASYPSNLTITPTQQTVSTGSSFVIKSNNTLRGPFYVTFSAQCGSTIQVKVNVTN
jgi:prepilin-type N-terminal cleavage/methylation domain-containing protein